MKAELLREQIESSFEFIDRDGRGPLAPTGERYVELTGIGTSGERAALDAFEKYAGGRKGKLYWRVTPEVADGQDGTIEKFYMRLLISDKKEKR